MIITDKKTILVQVMAWWRQATSHHRGQCWHRSMSPYDDTGRRWVVSVLNIPDFNKYSTAKFESAMHMFFAPTINQYQLFHCENHILQWEKRHCIHPLRIDANFSRETITLTVSGYAALNIHELFALTYWGLNKMTVILQTTFLNAFSWTRMYEFRLLFKY